MKKIYLTLLGACFALGASAQFELGYRSGEWQIDSTYTVDFESGERMTTDRYEYNGDGTIAVMYSESWDDSALFEGRVLEKYKSVFTYDGGRLVAIETYLENGADWLIESKEELSDFDANGNPATVIYYEVDEDDEGQLLPSAKWEVTKWAKAEPADYKLYQPDFGSWDLYSTTVSEVNDQGLITKQTDTSELFGVKYVSTTTYEYDDHGYPTKEVSTSDFGSSEETYVNTYDANGNILTATQFYNGKEDETTYYFWSKDGQTAINGMRLHKADGQWFDLGGRRLNGQPTRKGIFIQNGKKVIR
ncbi:MAG: hypothetical protein IJV25_02210 [Prevotella sp.]|nr:hypothetical protein [Prevotella sp.]